MLWTSIFHSLVKFQARLELNLWLILYETMNYLTSISSGLLPVLGANHVVLFEKFDICGTASSTFVRYCFCHLLNYTKVLMELTTSESGYIMSKVREYGIILWWLSFILFYFCGLN